MRSFGQLWPTLKRLLAYGSPWRKPLSVAVMMLWIAAAAEVSGPLLISYFIDNMVARHHLPLGKVAGLAAAYVGLQFLAAGLHYAQSLLFNRAAVGVVQSLRTDVMDAALRQPLSAFDTQPVGQLISRVTNDTEVIRDLYVTVVATVLRSAALIGAMLVAMFSLDWRMALVAILIFPAVLTVMIIYQRYSTPIVRRVRAYLADINDGFNEIINGMSVIQQFRQQARFGERMGEASRSHYMARMQTLRLDGFLLRPLLSLFSALILCGLLMLFSFTSAGTIEVGVLYAFISYLSRLNEPLIELTTQQSMLQQAVVAGERVFELMDRPRQRYGSDDRPLQSGAIDIDHLSFAYRDDNLVLQDITLSVPSRSFVALVGHTGSGKSTLASLLMGYYPLTQGEIRLDGREISSLNHRVLRQGVAMVQQDPVVMADTFLANVTLGRDVSEAQVWQALETVQLADLARGLSDGLHTHLGEQGNTLSVGQKQLLALAERIRFSAVLIFVVVWFTLSYIPIAHMVWGGGLLAAHGALDFAGGTVVHINAAIAGLVGAYLIGKRVGFGKEAFKPHNLPMVFTGTAILYIGWFGFNAGSAGSANEIAALAFVNTVVATAAAILGWIIGEWTLRGKPSLLGACSGAIAGLVGVTPACGYVGVGGALVIGVIAGLAGLWGVTMLKRLLRVDDPCDVFGVHGVCGIVGCILTGVFAASSLGGVGFVDGVTMGHQVMVQLESIAITVVWSGVVAFVGYKLADILVGLRVPEEQEREGLDVNSHGENAYNA
ncbi:SmdB family multidrug efflux ABC transporter permease/ATP-binding protein [Salmonella enterica]|nr:SmdB family multidrug efflux ABC transporter permease/ATP-binding protein [Salmonella enterica]